MSQRQAPSPPPCLPPPFVRNCATSSCPITMRPRWATNKPHSPRSPSSEGPRPCPRWVGSPSYLRRPRELGSCRVFLSERKANLSFERLGSRALWERTCLPLSTPPPSLAEPRAAVLTDTHCVFFRLPLHRQVHIAAACAHAQAQTSEAEPVEQEFPRRSQALPESDIKVLALPHQSDCDLTQRCSFSFYVFLSFFFFFFLIQCSLLLRHACASPLGRCHVVMQRWNE